LDDSKTTLSLFARTFIKNVKSVLFSAFFTTFDWLKVMTLKLATRLMQRAKTAAPVFRQTIMLVKKDGMPSSV
jgi:hypothetical protein